MNDFEALQGLWQVHSSTFEGRPVDESATHYVISGKSMQEIVPDLVDDGSLRSTFFLDESTAPKRLTLILDYNGPDGPPDPNPIVLRYLYRLEGDTLTLCSDEFGDFPLSICDDYSIMTLVRDTGPVPESQRPAGIPTLKDEQLGELEWDNNLRWYRGRLQIADLSFRLSLNPEEGTDVTHALLRAKQVVGDFARYRAMAAEYAVSELLDLKNSTWLDDDERPITAEEFKARMRLESITVESDSSTTFWHDDGDLFYGHSIQVSIDADDHCTGVDIPG